MMGARHEEDDHTLYSISTSGGSLVHGIMVKRALLESKGIRFDRRGRVLLDAVHYDTNRSR